MDITSLNFERHEFRTLLGYGDRPDDGDITHL
jgi:hypothetical protein